MEQYNYMPIGTVVSYAGATTPIGWLLCDGRIIEEHEYPDLYRVLGSGVLPDLRGEFVRGLDNGRGLDGGRVLGSEQGDAIRNITGTANSCVVGSTGDGISHGAFSKDLITNIETFVSGELPYNNLKFDASLVVPTAEENRPKNVALNYIIKAFNTTTDTETLPIQMAKALNNKIENNYNDQLDATVDIVGKEFYDYIQNSGEKTAGKIYRDRLQKGIFRCLKTTTSILNTSEFYEPISNNDLLGRLNNLSAKFSDTYTDTRSGIAFELRISKVGNCCTFNFRCWGTNEANDPILFTLPSRYFPAHTVRVVGYPIREHTDLIINTNGVVMLSGSIGENKDNIEVGCGYMTFN